MDFAGGFAREWNLKFIGNGRNGDCEEIKRIQLNFFLNFLKFSSFSFAGAFEYWYWAFFTANSTEMGRFSLIYNYGHAQALNSYSALQ